MRILLENIFFVHRKKEIILMHSLLLFDVNWKWCRDSSEFFSHPTPRSLAATRPFVTVITVSSYSFVFDCDSQFGRLIMLPVRKLPEIPFNARQYLWLLADRVCSKPTQSICQTHSFRDGRQ